MKLRNKKTGEIESVSIDTFGVDEKDRRIGISVLDFNSPSDYRCIASYSSLADLNAEWEDYKPAEPLLTKEASRILRGWAELNGLEKEKFHCQCIDDETMTFIIWKMPNARGFQFDIPKTHASAKIALGTDYTITELCGEEEAPEILEPTFVDLDKRIEEKGRNITLGEPGSFDMVANFETGQVRLCAAGDSYYDNFVSFKDFLGFAEELKEALEEEE